MIAKETVHRSFEVKQIGLEDIYVTLTILSSINSETTAAAASVSGGFKLWGPPNVALSETLMTRSEFSPPRVCCFLQRAVCTPPSCSSLLMHALMCHTCTVAVKPMAVKGL